MNRTYDILILGGGAAGFFTALNLAEARPDLKIAILERGRDVLEKVRISGGGRCNVTHACFIPNELAKFYPRGEKELRGPFHQFAPGDTIAWFEKRGVALKTEQDGRMFPITDSSQTIIDCFLSEAKKMGVAVLTGHSVQAVFKGADYWKVETTAETFACSKLIMATGSNPKMWKMLEELGHSIVPAVPSLFTFNIKDARIKDLPGVSCEVRVKVEGSKLESSGPLLITHWGMSGPAILKLSAWGAREFFDRDYKFAIRVNWLKDYNTVEIAQTLRELKLEHAKKTVAKKSPFEMTNRLWESLVLSSGIGAETKWADLSKTNLQKLAETLTASRFEVNGKSTFKEEFVTAGGIDLREINFKTMESKIYDNLYFAGEIVNIDAITGGFNFQNAWTGGFILAYGIKNNTL